MRTSLKIIFFIMSLIATSAINATGKDGFVTVENGKFMLNGKPYVFAGTNMWYAPILASTGQGGNRERLKTELDKLQEIGIDNLRILVGADGDMGVKKRVQPVLQTGPNEYNDTLLDGLDYLLMEMEQRGMKGVFYLNNAWEWSGGYAAYLQWAGAGKSAEAIINGWSPYVNFVKQFVSNEKAKEIFYRHVRNIVSRTNRLTGKPYKDSPAIMAWQVANEPRAFSRDGLHDFADWILTTARIIKEIDPNHLVSTGSEGMYGCEFSIDTWQRIHTAPEIDYAIIHVWPYTWRWVRKESVFAKQEIAHQHTLKYVTEHYNRVKEAGKPLVLEEFGYHRDEFSFAPEASVTARDKFYEFIFSLVRNGVLAGCNFWAWNGSARAATLWWKPGNDYMGDPAQEEQGLYGVFDCDTTTLQIIKNFNDEIKQTK